jgi:hypothetical protein
MRTYNRQMAQPFVFWGCSQLRESLNVRADSERQLLERLESVPAESIYTHSVRYLLRRSVVATAYPDDFSNWVATEVPDPILAERLALPSPFDFPDVEAFRAHLVEILDDHLSRLGFAPRVLTGNPFYFLRGHLVAVPLGIEAHDLPSFRDALRQVDESSLYYHAVEAIGRLGKPRGDFAAWLEEALDLPRLAHQMAELDPFVLSLRGMRQRMMQIIAGALGEAEA